MQVLGGGLQVAMTKQHLDGAQVGAGLQQMGRPTVAQRMRSNTFTDASLVRSLAACDPNGFVRNWLIESSATGACGEQIESRFAPAPVLAQDLQQGWTQRQVAIFATLARNHP